MRYRIIGWHEYQHYKDRCPPWIKLHNSMLTSEVWVMGSDQTRTLAIACMLLAARDKANDGSFNGDPEYVKRFGYLNSKPDFKQLIEFNFIELLQDASAVLAPCNTETETETETEKRQRKSREETDRAFALPDWVDQKTWDLWLKTRKGKKMIPEQMQAQVDKLEKWKNAGLDYSKALKDSADSGWQGLFEPKTGSAGKNYQTPDERRMASTDKAIAEWLGEGNTIEGECHDRS